MAAAAEAELEGLDLLRLRVEQMGVLREGSGERVMGCLQLPGLLPAGQKEREVHHPQKAEDRRVAHANAARLQEFRTLEAEVAQGCPLGAGQSRGSEPSDR